MNDTKKWYTSKTMWGGLVALVSSITMMFGYSISPDIQLNITDVIVQAGGVVGAVIAIYGRLVANTKLQ